MKVVIAGGHGALGGRVRALCKRLAPTLDVVPASRRGRGGERLDLHADGLAGRLEGFDALVNAVGPYDYDPSPILRACAEARCHYVDLAELPRYVEEAEEASRKYDAAGAGVAVVCGASTSPGLLASLAGEFLATPGVESIDAWLSIGTDNPATPALLFGLLRPLGETLPDGERAFSRVFRRDAAEGTTLAYGRYPFPRRGSRVRVGERDLPLRFYAGFDRALLAHVLRRAASWLPRIADSRLHFLSRIGSLAANAGRPFGGRVGRLALDARDAAGGCVASLEVRADRDGLNVPASPPVWALERLAEPGTPSAGWIPFEALIDADAAKERLRKLGCRVDTWERPR